MSFIRACPTVRTMIRGNRETVDRTRDSCVLLRRGGSTCVSQPSQAKKRADDGEPAYMATQSMSRNTSLPPIGRRRPGSRTSQERGASCHTSRSIPSCPGKSKSI
jgi:hypothetical protein